VELKLPKARAAGKVLAETGSFCEQSSRLNFRFNEERGGWDLVAFGELRPGDLYRYVDIEGDFRERKLWGVASPMPGCEVVYPLEKTETE